jgi:hypothetical protein
MVIGQADQLDCRKGIDDIRVIAVTGDGVTGSLCQRAATLHSTDASVCLIAQSLLAGIGI